VRAASAALTVAGVPHIVTREPGGTTIGEQIRAILLGAENRAMVPKTEVMLLLAARAQHLAEVITPALERGDSVLCDRYAGATFAYQGYGRGLPLDELRQLQAFAAGDLLPDLTLLYDLPAETGLARRQAAGDVNRLDAAGLAFHRAVRDGYLDLARADRARWQIIDATEALDAVTAETRAILAALFAVDLPE
jgi:dTMP kinase